ncbi:MAG TPA: hypothetical protein PLR99_14285 [Polyangiaceae bacterium]|nr:hypothetical protein [Polyangiaceae bacterium]
MSGPSALFRRALFLTLGARALWACSDGAAPPADAGVVDLGAAPEAGPGAPATSKPRVDGGFPSAGDAGVLPASRFASRVVSFTPGDCAGFGLPSLPDVVLGPPEGAGATQGGLDVLSLGVGGSIVLSFEADPIVDGPGVDFLVFENAFYAAGRPEAPFAEPATVSVSDDGVTWKSYPCTATSAPYGACAGWHPVYSASNNAISPFDVASAGGDPFDLADVGLARARFVRIVDRGLGVCPPNPEKLTTGGFDLDAIASVNHEGR